MRKAADDTLKCAWSKMRVRQKRRAAKELRLEITEGAKK
jgi:hypothetical protein